MRIGTKSVFFGVHQFLLHPLLIALGWWKEYGWRHVPIGAGVTTHLLDPRLWLAFIVHDLGYLGKPNMDGEEGETHPEFGARVMRRLFGAAWGDFVLLHSRYYAKRLGLPVSALAMADKWVIILEPSWLYLPRAWASGELAEYLDVGAQRANVWQPTDAVTHEEAVGLGSRRPLAWHRAVKAYMRRWIAEHRDGRQDTWTRHRHGTAIDPAETGGPPEHLRLMLARFRQGCEVCGVMAWKATASGEMACGCCGNVFDVPVIEERVTGGQDA